METETETETKDIPTPMIRTIQEGKDAIKAIREARKATGNKHAPSSQQTRNRNLKIVAIKVKMNSIKSRLVKNNWVECEFQDLPMGSVFSTNISLSVKYNKSGGLRKSGAKDYKCMNSCGSTAFILSRGYDQGSMLDLDANRPVWTRQDNKLWLKSGRGKSESTIEKDNSEEFNDDWAGV